MGGMSGVGSIGELPAGPDEGVENLHPPAKADPALIGQRMLACSGCQEQDTKGERLYRVSGQWVTCGAFSPSCGRGQAHPDGPGCLLDLVWMYQNRQCPRGKW